MRDSWHAEISVLATVASTTSPLRRSSQRRCQGQGRHRINFPFRGPETTSWVRGCPCTTRASNKGFNRAKKRGLSCGVKGRSEEDPGQQVRGMSRGAPLARFQRDCREYIIGVYQMTFCMFQAYTYRMYPSEEQVPAPHETHPCLSVCIQPFSGAESPGV